LIDDFFPVKITAKDVMLTLFIIPPYFYFIGVVFLIGYFLKKKITVSNVDHTVEESDKQKEQQERLTKGLWATVRAGTVQELEELYSTQGREQLEEDIKIRGAFGETVLHIACLFANFPAMKWLVTRFPSLLEEGYLSDLYKGETALHMCVVHGDEDSVQFLLEQDANINAKCTGTFFQPKKWRGNLFWGTCFDDGCWNSKKR